MGPSTRVARQESAPKLTFKRLLVPLDGSAQSEEAFAVASALSRRRESDLVLCTVLAPLPEAPPSSPAQASAELAQRYLAEIVGMAQDRGIRATGIVRTGAVCESLLEVAAEEGASLIVLSAQDRRIPASGRLTPIPEQLLRSSPIPILAATPRSAFQAGNLLDAAVRPLRTMLVAPGRSSESAGLLDGSLRFAEAFGVDLAILLQVVPHGRTGREEAELRVEAEERLRDLVRPFQEAQIPTVPRVTSGEPIESILSVATSESADVIAVAGPDPRTAAEDWTAVEELIGRSSVPVLSFTAPSGPLYP